MNKEQLRKAYLQGRIKENKFQLECNKKHLKDDPFGIVAKMNNYHINKIEIFSQLLNGNCRIEILDCQLN